MTVRLCPSLRAPPPGERDRALTTPQREHHLGGPLRGRRGPPCADTAAHPWGWQLRQRSRLASVDEPVRLRPSPPGSRKTVIHPVRGGGRPGSTPGGPTITRASRSCAGYLATMWFDSSTAPSGAGADRLASHIRPLPSGWPCGT